MNEDALIRRTNLRNLCHARKWGPSELAARVERKPNYISDLLAGVSSTGKVKSFGERIARHIESKLKLPRNWLDTPHDKGAPLPDDEMVADSPRVEDQKATYLIPLADAEGHAQPLELGGVRTPSTGARAPSDVTNDVRAPVIAWSRLGLDLTKSNTEIVTEERRPYAAQAVASKNVKCICVHDNALYPDLRPGDMVFLDPENTRPGRDRIALFVMPDGEYILRRYRPLVDDDFEAYDAANRVMTASRHGLVVVATLVTMQRDDV